MPELQDDNKDEQKIPKRKLTWDELSRLNTKKRQLQCKKRWNKLHPDKVKENTRKQNLKARYKYQKEHPIEVITKRKFWIIKR